MALRLLSVAVLLAVASVLPGCGGQVKFESVEGTVTLDKAPVPGVFVSITPKDATLAADSKLRGPYTDFANDQGHFSLGPPLNRNGGAPAGAYTLIISTKNSLKASDESAPPPKELIPAPYSSPGVDFEVPAGGKTDANFDLTSTKKR